MIESVKVHYVVSTTNDAGAVRDYGFSHPYGAPAEEAFAALEAIRSQIEMRVAEIHNAQLAAQAARRQARAAGALHGHRPPVSGQERLYRGHGGHDALHQPHCLGRRSCDRL